MHCRCGGQLSDFIGRSLIQLGERQVSYKQLKKLQQVVASAKAGPPGACVCHMLPVGPTTMKELTRRFAGAVVAGATAVAGGLEALKAVVNAGVESRRPRSPVGFYSGSKQWELTAFHEAGHAVLSVLMGVPLKEVVMGDKAAVKQAMGFIQFDWQAVVKDSMVSDAQRKAEYAALFLAGAAAEKWFGEHEPDLSGPDLKQVKRLFKDLAGRKPDAHALGGMVSMLSSVFTNHWVGRAVKRVADLVGGTIGGATAGEKIERLVREEIGSEFAQVALVIRSQAMNAVMFHVEHAKSLLEYERKQVPCLS